MPTLQKMWTMVCRFLGLAIGGLTTLILIRGLHSTQEIILCIQLQVLLLLCFFVFSAAECYLRPRLSVLLVLLTYTSIGLYLALANDIYLVCTTLLVAFFLCYLVLIDYTNDRYYEPITQIEID
jgi:hypothetical protein